ncbi:hypothetical protein [Arthrobacter sp. ISL-5]|uniref:hypothetical protein n=1 Tax=Arthrobacter sp. ISL-5 TaxID=2819111 RepID=UPI001BE50DB7|nr:hypothetical protein [Arthrobacter sp. ISL-5]MBT2551536.1 hypothetical protein [Arthrobacter sp. ISL-5]
MSIFSGSSAVNRSRVAAIAMREALQPFIVRQDPHHRFALIEYGNGSADVYLDSDGMMANHISGEDLWISS